MKTITSLAPLALALPALAQGSGKPKCKKYVTSEALQELITLDDLLAGSQKLQDFADANGGNRAFGSGGHNATVDWLYDTLDATGYYDVVKQPFVELFASAEAELTVGGEVIETQPMTYTPGGSGSGTLVYVEGFGCTADQFPAEAEGSVVILSRGECSFSQKAVNAKIAGVSTLLVYNNEPGMLSGTLGDPYLDYAPALGLTQEDGQAIVASIQAGEEVLVEADVDALVEDRVNFNVIAETKKGDHDNVLVLGGHSDSVAAGPGIK
jgi:Zn-dependent M28 family amino/carboxypeptidase